MEQEKMQKQKDKEELFKRKFGMKNWLQHRVKLIAGFSLPTKILADFLFGFYLLNYLLNHATNHIQTRYPPFKKTSRTRIIL